MLKFEDGTVFERHEIQILARNQSQMLLDFNAIGALQLVTLSPNVDIRIPPQFQHSDI
jgi:hypothetical protein